MTSTRRLAAALAAALALTLVAPARAETLDDLLAAARANSLDLEEQEALALEADAETRLEKAARLPSLSITGFYAINQREVIIELPGDDGMFGTAPIAPRHQLDATITLSVPLLDIATWKRIDAADANADARRATAAAAALEVDRAVVVAYYQWVAGNALVEAAQVSQQTAADSLAVIEGRLAAGFASQVDVARAKADVARAAQSIADAELIVANATRQLETLTGRAPTGAAPPLPTDVAEEAPLAEWTGDVDRLPSVRAAHAAFRAGRVAYEAASVAWLPTVSAFASERLTNAEGFGAPDAFSAGVTATWNLDARTYRAAQSAQARYRTGAVRTERATQEARDRIVDAWNAIEARRAASVAAAAQLEAAGEALSVARTRIAAGLTTPLDLLTAQRDAFSAEVGLVQARAELAAARALLRLAAGRRPSS